MIESLIKSVVSYKARMLYKNLDFDTDKVGLYIEVRLAMAVLYNKDEELYFGLVAVDIINEKETKEVIKRGAKRIQEKLKEIRQNFQKQLLVVVDVEVVKLYLSFMTSSFSCGVVPPILEHLRLV